MIRPLKIVIGICQLLLNVFSRVLTCVDNAYTHVDAGQHLPRIIPPARSGIIRQKIVAPTSRSKAVSYVKVVPAYRKTGVGHREITPAYRNTDVGQREMISPLWERNPGQISGPHTRISASGNKRDDSLRVSFNPSQGRHKDDACRLCSAVIFEGRLGHVKDVCSIWLNAGQGAGINRLGGFEVPLGADFSAAVESCDG